MFQKQEGKKPLLLRNREPTDLNQTEPNQIENAKQKVTLNLNQRAIQPLANICWNSISAHATILIRSSVSLEPVGSSLYFTEKNRFVQAKAVRIHSTTVSVRSKPAGIG